MMKKETSKTWKIVKAASLLPIAALLVLAFSNTILAQGTSAKTELTISLDKGSQLSKDEYYKGAFMRWKNSAGVTIRKRYEELTSEEKSFYPPPAHPTEELMASWKDTKKFAVHLGYEKALDSPENLKAKDFVSYYVFKSDTEPLIDIFLIRPDFLEKIKKLGGDFNREGSQVFLAPPPPVIIPAKKN